MVGEETIAFGGVFILIILIWISMIIAGICLLIFWIFMIIDCAKRKFKDDTEKIVWILVIILANWMGALIYYFVVKKKNKK